MLLKNFSGYQRDGNLVWAQRSSHGQHNLFKEHVHNFIELIYIVQSKGRHRINGTYYDTRAGDVFIIMPGESHHFPDAKDFSLEIINCLYLRESLHSFLPVEPGSLLELPYLAPFYKTGERMPRKLSLTSDESTVVLAKLEEMIQELKGNGIGANMIATHLLISLLIRLSRICLRQNAPQDVIKPLSIGHEILVRNVITYLEQNFQQKMTAEDLAKRFTISPRHLNRVFRQQTGNSITSTLQHIRIKRAKHMLIETNRSIDSIASAVGFGDSSHFNRLFSRIAGCSPSRYRKQARKKHIS